MFEIYIFYIMFCIEAKLNDNCSLFLAIMLRPIGLFAPK